VPDAEQQTFLTVSEGKLVIGIAGLGRLFTDAVELGEKSAGLENGAGLLLQLSDGNALHAARLTKVRRARQQSFQEESMAFIRAK
jgi:hypothetical protein